MNLKQYLYLGLAVIVAAFSIWAYGQWKDYQALKFEHQMTLQNAQAFKDSANIQAAKVTILASQVHDLAAENKDLKGKIVALQIDNQALIAQINAHGTGTATVTDTTIKVAFKDSIGIVHYNGETQYNLKTKESTYYLFASFEPINTKTVLFKDPVDGLWKLKSISLTEGITVKGISTLDDDTFAALQKYTPPTPPKTFGLNVQFGTTDFYGGIIFRFSDRWYLNLNYKVVNQQPKWIDNTLIGVSYFVF